jgi:crotonobetainyl-CoA:carnitine CoA-transferase CaiB-like acyl-CoA transferase
MTNEFTRRRFINSVLTGFAATQLPGCDSTPSGETKPASSTHRLPYAGIRIIEQSELLTGRLAGLLFADQGAEVLIARDAGFESDEHDEFLDRNKYSLAPGELADTSSADVIIVDGDADLDRSSGQIVLRVTAALPGDTVYGDLPADCSEDLLNALVGFYTDMGTISKLIGRPVIYTPLPLCSVYAAVNGAVATAAALIDRERCGSGREVIASRLAGGLSAIGALALTSEGMPDHLEPADITGVPEGLSLEDFKSMMSEASQDAKKQLWVEQRFIPLAVPYETSDGRLAIPLAAPNRRLTQRILQSIGVWDQALEAGMVDVDPYDPVNAEFIGRNLADSMGLNFPMSSALAELVASAFIEKPAAEWEKHLCSEVGVPCLKVITWEEFKNDPDARTAHIFAHAKGHSAVQLGRPSWVASAQPYPDLMARQHIDSLPARSTELPTARSSVSKRPLEGYTLVDFTNVVAGPSAGRMFSELGATVYKIDPVNPYHSPVIMTTWAAELGVGKRTMILDIQTDEGRKVLNKILVDADWILNNALDAQYERLDLDRAGLDKVNPSIISIQLSAHKAEKPGARDDYPGYDPVIQAQGIMERFGPEGCPSFHGVASCVDYLCGYLGAWAGVTAMYAREFRKDGIGDWAETSLSTAAALTQLLLLQSPQPESATGAFATGMNAGERVYELSDGWIFAQGAHDLTEELSSLEIDAALAKLSEQGISAVPVHTCKELADLHRDNPTTTVYFEMRESDGWKNECFAPAWFAYDGERVASPGPAHRVGSDAPLILAELGYSEEEVADLVAARVVGQTEFLPFK